MATDKKSKAYKAIERARTVLVVTQPFFGCLALHLDVIEDKELKHLPCPTMGTNGREMFFYPPFVESLSEQELVGVVAHEVMHAAFGHMTRRRHRDPTIYNMAGDFSINSDLKKAGFTLPGQPITMRTPRGAKGHLYDPQYDGMSTEEIYEKIFKDVPKILIQLSGGSSGSSGQKGDEDSNGDGNGQKITIKIQDYGGCGVAMDAAAPHDKAKAEEIQRQWDETVRMAVNVARTQNAGTVPGCLERLVKELKRPRVSW